MSCTHLLWKNENIKRDVKVKYVAAECGECTFLSILFNRAMKIRESIFTVCHHNVPQRRFPLLGLFYFFSTCALQSCVVGSGTQNRRTREIISLHVGVTTREVEICERERSCKTIKAMHAILRFILLSQSS